MVLIVVAVGIAKFCKTWSGHKHDLSQLAATCFFSKYWFQRKLGWLRYESVIEADLDPLHCHQLHRTEGVSQVPLLMPCKSHLNISLQDYFGYSWSTRQATLYGVWRWFGGCRAAAPPKPPKTEKKTYCRYYDIKSFTWFTLHPKSATEISWWLVH